MDDGSNGRGRKADADIAVIKNEIINIRVANSSDHKEIKDVIKCLTDKAVDNKTDIAVIKSQTTVQWYFIGVIVVALVVSGIKIFS